MLQNGHADVQVDAGQNTLSFSYKRGGPISYTDTVSQKDAKTLILSYKHATFDLAQLLANHDGHLRWGGYDRDRRDLDERTRNWTLNETRLLAEFRTDHGEWKWDGIDLTYRFRIGDEGELFALKSPEEGAMIMATGKPVSQSDWLKDANADGQRILQ